MINPIFALTSVGLLVFLGWVGARTDTPAPIEYDVSGFGTCDQVGQLITISNYTHTVWAQSPRSVALSVPISNLNFNEKNGILNSGRRDDLLEVVTTPDGTSPFQVKVIAQYKTIRGPCTFTLDPTESCESCSARFEQKCKTFQCNRIEGTSLRSECEAAKDKTQWCERYEACPYQCGICSDCD